jgi:hypothetical protein
MTCSAGIHGSPFSVIAILSGTAPGAASQLGTKIIYD